VLAKLLAPLAVRLVRDDWRQLRYSLIRAYSAHHLDILSGPPLIAQQLLISGEDHRHFRHGGFDWIAICRALWKRIAFNVIEGGSTIEQQIVRVLTGRYERTLRRKVREILLAILITRVIPKGRLAALYLEIGYYGWRMNGLQEACDRLQLNPSVLTIDQAAELVARLKYPEPRIPSVQRVSRILRRAEHLKGLYRRHSADGTYLPVTTEEGIRTPPLSAASRSCEPRQGYTPARLHLDFRLRDR